MKINKNLRILGIVAVVLCLMVTLGITVFAAETTNVAEVNGTEYDTLQKAINAAADGQTITLLKDCSDAATFTANGRNIIIDGGATANTALAETYRGARINDDGYTYTGTLTVKGEGSITFKNMNVAPANTSSKTGAVVLGSTTAPDVTFVDCILKGKNGAGNIVYSSSLAVNNEVTFKYCNTTSLSKLVMDNQTGPKKIVLENVTATNMIYLLRSLKCPSITLKNVTCSAVIAIEVNNAGYGHLTLENVNLDSTEYSGSYFTPIKDYNGSGVGYDISVKGECVFTYGGVAYNDNEWFDGDANYNVTIAKPAYVAQIDKQGYKTLADAIAAAKDGDTIVLLADNAEEFEFAQNGGKITIDGNGKTFTGKITLNAGSGELVITNATLTPSNADAKTIFLNAATAPNITIDGCTMKNTGTKGAIVWGQVSSTANKVVIKNSTASNLQYLVGTNQAGCEDVTIDNVTATNMAYLIRPMKATKVTVKNVTYSGLTFVQVKNSGASTLAIENVTVTTTQAGMPPVTMMAPDAGTPTVNYTITLKGENVVNGAAMTPATENAWFATAANGLLYEIIDLNKTYVAKIGTKGYETIAEAIVAAKDGDTITLLADLDMSEILVIDKAITLDGNGKKLTSTAGRAINIETTGKVVISNLTINAGERAINIINKAATVELNNVTATASNNAVMIATSAGAVNLTINNSNLTGLAVVNVAGAGAEVKINNTTITNKDASDTENYGAITVWSSAAGANVTVSGGTIVVADESKNGYVFPADATITGVDNVGYIVATIGDAGFETLKGAIENAKDGQTIVLVRDVNMSEILVINKAITLDGNGKTLTSTAGRAINVATEGNVTIKNLTINAKGERAINVITKPATLTIYNVTATAANYTVNVATSAGAANVAISNSTLNGLCTVNVAAAGANVTVDNSTINCNDNNTTAGESYAALSLNKEAIGGSIVATNTTVKVTAGSDSSKGRNGAENGTVTINGSTDGVVVMVAAITYAGSDNYHAFASLAAAIEFAKAGDTITLIRNITASDIITIDKAITLDGNGKTLTSTAGRAINVSGADGVTIKNLTINASGERAINVIQNATNVTIDNVTATAANYTVNVAGSAANAVVAIKNSTLTGLNVINVAAAGANVTVDGGTLICNDQTTVESYAALAIATNASKATITATDVNFEINGDSTNAGNGTIDGTITIDGVVVGQKVAMIQYANGTAYTFTSLADAIDKAQEGETIVLLAPVVITDDTTIANVTIDGNGVYPMFRVQDDATLIVNNVNFVNATDYVFTVGSGANDADTKGYLVINSGNFVGATTIVNVVKGEATINGGTFMMANDGDATYMLNCIDASYRTGKASIKVNGGTFYGFDPAENAAEGEGTNFLSDKCCYNENDDGSYTVRTGVAKVGTKTYNSLQEAINGAASGAKITLLGNAKGPGVVINKNITINFGKFTYTITKAAGGTDGFQILAGNKVTLSGAKVNGKAAGTLKAAEGTGISNLIAVYGGSASVYTMCLYDTNLVRSTEAPSYLIYNDGGTISVPQSNLYVSADSSAKLFYVKSGAITVNSVTKIYVENDGKTYTYATVSADKYVAKRSSTTFKAN